MKYIVRWSLMRNVHSESVAEHSYHVAVLAHTLAVISRDVFKKEIDPARAATAALYHDLPEILTGDLPTPIKYYSADIRRAYKDIERASAEKLLSGLTKETHAGISAAALDDDEDIARIIHAADKLDAYIKCREELLAGNREFAKAEGQIKAALEKLDMPELKYFSEHFLPAFSLTLDELE